MKQAVQVTILGQHYTLKSEASTEEVRKVADFVNGKLAELSAARATLSSLDLALLALMNVAADYLLLHNSSGDGKEQNEFLRKMIDRIDAACRGEESRIQG